MLCRGRRFEGIIRVYLPKSIRNLHGKIFKTAPLLHRESTNGMATPSKYWSRIQGFPRWLSNDRVVSHNMMTRRSEEMRGLGILATVLALEISGCGVAGSVSGSAGSSLSTTPPSRTASSAHPPSGSATTHSSTITVTIPAGPTSSRVAIQIPSGTVNHSESQTLATEIHQLNQLLSALQHP